VAAFNSLLDHVRLGTLAAAQIVKVLPRARISRAVGQLSDAALPAAVSGGLVAAYTRLFRVDMSEAQLPDDAAFYPSFDAFFTRALRSGSRPFSDDRRLLASPCDGWVESMGPIEPDGSIVVKGASYRAADLLGAAGEAERYHGGQSVVIYLSPRDYHRVHAPVAGRLVSTRSLPGDVYPVNRLGAHVPQLLVRNRRVALELETEELGSLCLVMVAAMMVGRITVTGVDAQDVPFGLRTLTPMPSLDAGDELGVFHLGSTVVLLAQPGTVREWLRAEGRIRAGEPLGRACCEPASGNGSGESRSDG
jgi:phosphatidylserine decarboxylase